MGDERDVANAAPVRTFKSEKDGSEFFEAGKSKPVKDHFNNLILGAV